MAIFYIPFGVLERSAEIKNGNFLLPNSWKKLSSRKRLGSKKRLSSKKKLRKAVRILEFAKICGKWHFYNEATAF